MLSLSDDLGYPNIQAILDNTLRSVRRTIRARNDVKQRCLESLMYKRTARDLRRLKKKRNDNLRRRIREKLVKEAKKRQRIERKLKAEMTNTLPPCDGAVPVEDGRGASAIVPSALGTNTPKVAVSQRKQISKYQRQAPLPQRKSTRNTGATP